MKKFLALVAFVIINTYSLFSQNNLRDAVVIVRPVYSEATISFLKDLAKSFRKDGYTMAATVLDSYTNSRFGTGFVYKDEVTNKCYIITNKHVIAESEYVKIEISKPNNKKTYDNCEIIAVHDKLDIALIALPDTAKFENTLKFANITPEDGAEVFSAGFPALKNEPSWQLGKGIISNSQVDIEELTNGYPVSIIQHTAQIDAGNSGGPLLIHDTNLPFKYEVIGINTWKAAGRENTNFAIPSTVVKEFISSYTNNENIDKTAYLNKRATDFIASLKVDFKEILPFISYNYISSISINSFYELIGSASDEAGKEMIKNFNDGFPIEGIRIALADAIYREFKSKNITLSSIENLDNTSASVTLNVNNKSNISHWVYEYGDWRIYDFSALNMRALGKKGVATSYGYRNSIRVGMGIAINSDFKSEFNLSFESSYFTFLTMGYNFYLGKKDVITTLGGITYIEKIIKTKTYGGFSMHIGGQLPIRISSVYLIPYLKMSYGILLCDDSKLDDKFFRGALQTGGEVAFKVGRKTYLLAGLGYKKRFTPSKPSMLDIHVGIAF